MVPKKNLNLKLSNKQLGNCLFSLLAFALPIILLGAALWYLYNSSIEDEAYMYFTQRYSDFNGTFLNGSYNEFCDLNTIRTMLISGLSYVKTEAIRYVLAYHFDLFFLICLLFNVASQKVFTTIMFIRIGLSAFSANYFVRKHIGVKGVFSLALSTAYALSGPVLIGTANSMVLNLAIVFPFLLSALDSLVRKETTKSRILLVVCVAMTAACGIYGFIAGFILVITASISIILIAVARGNRFKAAINVCISYIVGMMAGAVCIIPSIIATGGSTGISQLFDNNTVRYKLFDVIGTLFDGRILSTASVNGIPQVAVSITILFLYVLFLINERIPFGVKITSVISFVVIYVSISWSVADTFISIFGSSEVGVYSRLIIFVVLMLFYGAISLRNIGTLRAGEITTAGVILLSILVVHKAVCAEVGPSVFSVTFSFVSVFVLTGIYKFMSTHPSHPAESVFVSIIVAGIFVNTIFILGPSEFTPGFMVNKISSENAEKIIYASDDNEIPIFTSNSNNEYVFLTSDVSYFASTAPIPDVVNMSARAALLDDIYLKADSKTVYSHGFTDFGEGFYTPKIPGVEAQVTIRAEGVDMTKRYFVYSGFDTPQTLCELYGEDVVNTHFSGLFLAEIKPKSESFNLRLIMNGGNTSNEFTLWSVDEYALQAFRNNVREFSGSTIDLSDISLMRYPDTKSLITSIDYDNKYIVTDNNNRMLTTQNVAGKLGIIIDDPQSVTELTIKVPFYDMICGLIITIISVLICLLTALFTVIKKKNTDGGTANAG